MAKKNIEYTGTCLIGVVGPETDIGACRDSIEHIRMRPGDEGPIWVRATKGYEARQLLFDRLKSSNHAFLLLLDHDQTFPPDALERLRSHKLPYVSGYYMRRRFQPILPVWYEYGKKGQWPIKPWTAEPERNKLHRLGASGWGCILVHRAVVDAMQPFLKGEHEVIEDDLDVWPYDLARIMNALTGIRKLLAERPGEQTLYPALQSFYSDLESEIKPLRVKHDPVGSDLRFPFFARMAGFDLYGDPEVRCGHMLNYPLSPDDYSNTDENYRADMTTGIDADFNRERNELKLARGRFE